MGFDTKFCWLDDLVYISFCIAYDYIFESLLPNLMVYKLKVFHLQSSDWIKSDPIRPKIPSDPCTVTSLDPTHIPDNISKNVFWLTG